MTAKKYRVVLNEEQARWVVENYYRSAWPVQAVICEQLREQLDAVPKVEKVVTRAASFEAFCQARAARYNHTEWNGYCREVAYQAERQGLRYDRGEVQRAIANAWWAARNVMVLGENATRRLYATGYMTDYHDVTVDLRGIHWEQADGQFAPDITYTEGAHYKGFNWKDENAQRGYGIGPVIWVKWSPTSNDWVSRPRGGMPGSTWEGVNAWCKPGCQDLEPFGRTIQRLQRIVAQERTDLEMRDPGTWDAFRTPTWRSRAQLWLDVLEEDFARGGPPPLDDSSDSRHLGSQRSVGVSEKATVG